MSVPCVEQEDSLLGPADVISPERVHKSHDDLTESLPMKDSTNNSDMGEISAQAYEPAQKPELDCQDIEESLQALEDADINISAISKALSEASLSVDPSHLVNIIQSTLKRKRMNSNQPVIDTGLATKEPRSHMKMQDEKNMNENAMGLTTTPKTDQAPSRESVRCNLSSAKIGPNSSSLVRKTQSGSQNPDRSVSKHSSVSEPPTPRDTPTPPLTKSTSVPFSLDVSRRRRLSGTRHSSPVKKSPKKVVLANSCTPTEDLRSLLDEAEVTPSISVTARKHLLHTSTPFHPNLNLSTVILDNLTRNKSISPLVNPDLTINPVDLDMSTISPNLISSVENGKLPAVQHATPSAPDYRQVELHRKCNSLCLKVEDVDFVEVQTSHVWNTLKIPLIHNISLDMTAILKISKVWIGSLEIPENLWQNVINFESESLVQVNHDTSSIDFKFLARREGAFAVNLGLIGPNGLASLSAVARFQVEEPSVCVLTKNGHSVDFGTVPLRAKTSLPIMVINGGLSDLGIRLEISTNSSIFSLDGMKEVKSLQCHIPGGTKGSKESVAKEIKIWSDVGSIAESTETRVYTAKLKILLGDHAHEVVLGTVDILVRVCSARLVIDVTGKEAYTCISGEKCTLNLPLSAVGPIPLDVELSHSDTTEGMFTYEKKFKMLSGSQKNLAVHFTAKPGFHGKCIIEFILKLLPWDVESRIDISIQVVPRVKHGIFTESSPGIKLGVMGENEINLDRFPVESDRSLINWFAVEPGCKEEQLLNLRNSSNTAVSLNIMIRGNQCFKILTSSGSESSDKLSFTPSETKVIKLVFNPNNTDTCDGKLILKPVNLKVKGKIIKASISLNGSGGRPDMRLLDVKEDTELRYHLRAEKEPPTTLQFRVTNSGTGLGFVRLLSCEDRGGQHDKVHISPDSFILPAGETKPVQVLIGANFNYNTANIAVFLGPEIARSVYRRARLLPGAARLSASPVLMGLDFTNKIPAEQEYPAAQYSGDLTGDDVKHFYNKTERHSVEIEFPDQAARFTELDVEDTLSDTRLNATAFLHSPPTNDTRKISSVLKIDPQNLVLDHGSEAIVKVTNTGPNTVHWDLKWQSEYLNCSPPAGQLARDGQAILLISAKKDFPTGSQGWRGQVDIFSDQTVDSIKVQVRSKQSQVNKLTVFPVLLDFSELLSGSMERKLVTLTNPSQELVQWRGCIEAASAFIISQPSGVLNPGQSVTIPVNFNPGTPGIHRGVLDFTSHAIKVSKVWFYIIIKLFKEWTNTYIQLLILQCFVKRSIEITTKIF